MTALGTAILLSAPPAPYTASNYITNTRQSTFPISAQLMSLPTPQLDVMVPNSYRLAGSTPPLAPPTVGQLWPRGDHITGA